MELTKQQTQVLIGTVLGDGFLQKTGEKNARLRIEHSQIQKDYVQWKGNIFGRLFQGTPSFLERVHPKTKKAYQYARWQSSATPAFGKWQRYFYSQGKKTIPKDIDQFLTEPIGLAVWYMDDGYFSKEDRNSLIYLGKVSRQESEFLQNTVMQNFDIETKVYDKKNKGFALFFGVEATKKLHHLIRPFVVESFQYKLHSL
jgi:hypothetical protein